MTCSDCVELIPTLQFCLTVQFAHLRVTRHIEPPVLDLLYVHFGGLVVMTVETLA